MEYSGKESWIALNVLRSCMPQFFPTFGDLIFTLGFYLFILSTIHLCILIVLDVVFWFTDAKLHTISVLQELGRIIFYLCVRSVIILIWLLCMIIVGCLKWGLGPPPPPSRGLRSQKGLRPFNPLQNRLKWISNFWNGFCVFFSGRFGLGSGGFVWVRVGLGGFGWVQVGSGDSTFEPLSTFLWNLLNNDLLIFLLAAKSSFSFLLFII